VGTLGTGTHVLVLLLVVLDVLSTYLLLERYPPGLELNPVLRHLLSAYGPRVLVGYAPVEYVLIVLLLELQGRLLRRLGVARVGRYVRVTLLALYAAVLLNWVGVLLGIPA